ncbi:MAG TPA: branched-chain amino acid ABC transporter permease [Solirubrobacteraceae bacterium]|nr:branched-chain amino acid ABC transporter permease [Solirubrobacteraceae bacterium]
MNQFIELLLSGISLGFVYALVALGFVMIFKSSRVVNFAHGSILLLGAYVIARTHKDLGFLVAVLAGVAAASVFAVLVYYVILRRLRGASVDTVSIITIGVDIILLTELIRAIGSDSLSIGDPWGDGVVRFGEIAIPEARVAAAVVAAIVLLAFWALHRFTDYGIAMRSAAEDHRAAALMGIRLNRVSAGAWAAAGILAAVGGIFLTTFPTPGVDGSVAFSALAAFPAAILGGLDSIQGAVVGGLIIGIVVSLTSGYQSDIAFLGRGLSEITPYFVMVLVLLWRPSGLFGTRELTRV